jgi:hypothetical protein
MWAPGPRSPSFSFFAFCRDDPEAVDLNALYSEEEMSPDDEEELLGREVDLDDEYDL